MIQHDWNKLCEYSINLCCSFYRFLTSVFFVFLQFHSQSVSGRVAHRSRGQGPNVSPRFSPDRFDFCHGSHVTSPPPHQPTSPLPLHRPPYLHTPHKTHCHCCIINALYISIDFARSFFFFIHSKNFIFVEKNSFVYFFYSGSSFLSLIHSFIFFYI